MGESGPPEGSGDLLEEILERVATAFRPSEDAVEAVEGGRHDVALLHVAHVALAVVPHSEAARHNKQVTRPLVASNCHATARYYELEPRGIPCARCCHSDHSSAPVTHSLPRAEVTHDGY